MIKCHICDNKVYSTYTIIESRVSPFPGVLDCVRNHICGKCWKALGVDEAIKDLRARQDATLIIKEILEEL